MCNLRINLKKIVFENLIKGHIPDMGFLKGAKRNLDLNLLLLKNFALREKISKGSELCVD